MPRDTRPLRRDNLFLEIYPYPHLARMGKKDIMLQSSVKPRSYGLFFDEFRPRFTLLPVVGTGRIELARGLVSASVASRVMAVNSSHIKGGGVARRRRCIGSYERCREICARRGNKAVNNVL
ncbi:hypothetical protein AVEN_127352-1 [Araneus ventricosus]|uniref:Uncharacterized protein n=1 Tax=Araneus ventricosus TaxID=182803 RepID=A0A4Y2QUS6_ARAVE|nr:hypothetical protein AVEN_127352-1 [Araneus ventricosus]